MDTSVTAGHMMDPSVSADHLYTGQATELQLIRDDDIHLRGSHAVWLSMSIGAASAVPTNTGTGAMACSVSHTAHTKMLVSQGITPGITPKQCWTARLPASSVARRLPSCEFQLKFHAHD